MRTSKLAVTAVDERPDAVAVARKGYFPGSSGLPFNLPENLTLFTPDFPLTEGSVPSVMVFFLPLTVFLPSTSSFTVAAVESVKEIVVPRALPFGGFPEVTNFAGFSASFEMLGLVGDTGGGGMMVVVEPPPVGGVTTGGGH